jgi:hypothetical protein
LGQQINQNGKQPTERHRLKTTEELAKYIAARPGITNSRIRKNLGDKITNEMIEAAKKIPSASQGQPANMGKMQAQPLSGLIAQFDDVAKVRQAMKSLPKDSFLDDDELRRVLRVGPDRWKTVRQHPSVGPFRFTLPKGKSVWMHPEAQAKLNAAINLDQA